MSEVYEQAVAAAQAGDRRQALKLFAQAVQTEPNNENAWLGLASLLTGEKRREALEWALMINPENEEARRQLAYITGEEELPPVEVEMEEEKAAEAIFEPDAPEESMAGMQELEVDLVMPREEEPEAEVESVTEPELPWDTAEPVVEGADQEEAAAVEEPDAIQDESPIHQRTDMIAMMVEAVFGVFGSLGIGWMYAGNLAVGAGLLVGYLILILLEVGTLFTPLGVGACLLLPLNVVILVFSAVKVRAYARQVSTPGNLVFPILAVTVPAALFLAVLIIASNLDPVAADSQILPFLP